MLLDSDRLNFNHWFLGAAFATTALAGSLILTGSPVYRTFLQINDRVNPNHLVTVDFSAWRGLTEVKIQTESKDLELPQTPDVSSESPPAVSVAQDLNPKKKLSTFRNSKSETNAGAVKNKRRAGQEHLTKIPATELEGTKGTKGIKGARSEKGEKGYEDEKLQIAGIYAHIRKNWFLALQKPSPQPERGGTLHANVTKPLVRNERKTRGKPSRVIQSGPAAILVTTDRVDMKKNENKPVLVSKKQVKEPEIVIPKNPTRVADLRISHSDPLNPLLPQEESSPERKPPSRLPGTIAEAEYEGASLYPRPLNSNDSETKGSLVALTKTPAGGIMNTQNGYPNDLLTIQRPSKPSPANRTSTHQDVDSKIQEMKSQKSALKTANNSVTDLPACDSNKNPKPRFVTALSWNYTLDNVVSHSYTQEFLPSRGCKSGSWDIYDAGKSYLRTLTRTVSTNEIPFIDQKALNMIVYANGLQLHSETGIVFGKIPKGWFLSFLGRSERPLFFGQDNQPLLAEDLSQDRTFLLLNVEPGMSLVKLSEMKDNKDGAVAAWIKSGVATYLDFSRIQPVTLEGQVVDASRMQAKGLSNISVRILEQGQGLAVSDINGFFRIEQVMIVPGFHSFIETSSNSGLTHRVQARLDLENSTTLYRLPESQVEEWISHLNGGISDQSGILVAAFNTLVAAFENTPLVPSLSAFFDPPLVPQLYGLTAAGELKTSSTLSLESARLLGVQIPEGPNLVELSNLNQDSVWSEIIVSSPNIINMVGPY